MAGLFRIKRPLEDPACASSLFGNCALQGKGVNEDSPAVPGSDSLAILSLSQGLGVGIFSGKDAIYVQKTNISSSSRMHVIKSWI